MNFWTLFALALAVLWLQANAITCAALQAMRAEARARWEAMVSLERCLLERWGEEGSRPPAGLQGWTAILEQTIWTEEAPGVLAFFEERRRVGKPGPGCGVLELRCREAVRCYAEAAALYNERLSLPWGWPLSKWAGFLPVTAPPLTVEPD